MRVTSLFIALTCGRRRLRSFLLVLVMLTAGPIWLSAQPPRATAPPGDLYTVRLRRPSLVEHLIATAPKASNLHLLARTRPAENFQAQLRAEHQDFIARISANSSLSVVGDCTYLINVVFVRGTPSAVDSLESDPEVSGVYPSRPRYPVLDGAIGMIHAPELWDELGGVSEAGLGVRIAIIDSGIFQNHVMFRGDGLTPPAGFPKVDEASYLSFTNNKVIVARTFWRLFPDPALIEDHDPADQQGHGSKVAAIAAGRLTDAPLATIEGVAPMAFLGNYKIFGSGMNTSTTSAAVAAAINQAAEDGMEVINLSIGGSALEPGTEPEQEAIANAVKLGIVVVAAAGNLGPEAESLTFPGTSPDAITVGAVSNARTFGPGIEIGPQSEVPNELQAIAYTPGVGVSVGSQVGPAPIVSVSLWDPSEEACDSATIPGGALSGKIVLVKRGTCTFQEKADHVFGSGATAMVVYNNVRGGTILMAFDRVPDLPAVMIERDSGAALRDLILNPAHPTPITALLQPSYEEFRLPTEGDVLAFFSGRGPNIDGTIKPDLVAVGTDVYTASNLAHVFSQGSNGTSFATPMVTGAAALVHQLHPDWPVEAVKSALMSTTVKTPHVEDQPAHLVQMGSGRLDLSSLAEIDSYVDPASISFGFVDGARALESRAVSITNLGSSAHHYVLHFEPRLGTADSIVALSPDSLDLAVGQTGQIEITLDVAALPDGGSVEGFMVIAEDAAAPELTIPIWGALVTEDTGTTLEVSQRASATYRSLADAISAAKPGNLIEITDSGTYPFQGTLRTNAQGVPLNGLRIRSRAGETPTIDASGSSSQDAPVITVAGLQRVTLEGLHFRGGRYGIDFNQSTGVVKDCVVETDPASSFGYGIYLSSGSRVNVYGNRVGGTAGPAIAVFDSQALIQQNRIGDQSAGFSISGRGIDLNDSDPTALFDNWIQGGSASLNQPGILMTLSSALAKGNHVSGFGGETGDGIRVDNNLSYLESVGNLLSNNGRAGILVRSGAFADLRRDRILNNGSAGLRLESGASVTGQAEALVENFQGVVAVGSAVNLSDSLVAFSGDRGIVATTSTLQLLNDTIFGNGGAGVSVNSASSALIANSISFGNQGGQDLVGIDPAASFHNLTEEQTPAGGGASSGSGPLNDPENGDFAPHGGSPAVDKGGNDYVGAGQKDLAGHERIVDGNGDGTSQVDIGALEYASSSSPPLILPLTNPGPGEFIGLALTNAHSQSAGETMEPATIELVAHTVDGLLQSSPSIELDPKSQRSRLLSELLENPVEGWLQVLPSGPDIVGFTLVGDYAMTRLDGVALGHSPAPVEILPEVRTSAGSSTRVFIVNPASSPARVVMRWISSGQQPVSSPVWTIAPGGRLEVSPAELVGEGDGGYLRIESTSGTPISTMEIFGTDSAIAALSGISTDRGAGRLYGAQLAMTPAIGSEISLVNLGDAAAVTLEAFAESGQLVATRTLTLGAGEQWRGRATQLFGIDELVGWLRVSSDRGKLVGSVTFSDPSDRWMASLPLEVSGARESIFSHVAQTPEIYTGLTLLNPGSDPALVSIEVFDADGTLTGTAFAELDPGEKRARLLPEWIPSLSYQVEGFVRVRTNRPVIGFELFGSAANLAAVPQQVVLR